MMCKRSSLSLALLLCLTASSFLSFPAFAGTGCGTNWMGDTTGDTDFSVSKNQNQAASGASSSDAGALANAKAAVSLGSAASKSKNASIESLSPDRPGPQSAGAAILWTVQATSSGNEKILYDFLLSGPSTGGRLVDMTGWIEGNSWTWNTTNDDAGESRIVVAAKRAGSAGSEDRRETGYTINAASSSATSAAAVDADPSPSATSDTAFSDSADHPSSKTSDSISNKPRVAPDERTATVAKSSGPNMDMPDPTPKAVVSTEGSSQSMDAQPVQETAVEESENMDVEGKWTVKLDRPGETLDLSLIQTDGSVMGAGNLNEKDSKLAVSARGSVSGNSLSLDVWTVISEFGNKVDKSINLELVKVDRTVSGSYEMYTGEDLSLKGNATASRFAS